MIAHYKITSKAHPHFGEEVQVLPEDAIEWAMLEGLQRAKTSSKKFLEDQFLVSNDEGVVFTMSLKDGIRIAKIAK